MLPVTLRLVCLILTLAIMGQATSLASAPGAIAPPTTEGKSTPVDPKVAVDPRLIPPALQDPTLPFPGYWPEYPLGWQSTHTSMVERARQGNADLVFLGDSITQNWGSTGKAEWEANLAPLKAVNFGMGGDKTSQVLWRIEHGALDGLKPKLVVLAIGVNNIWTNENTNARVAEGIAACVKAIQKKSPQAKILIVGIFPVQQNPNHDLRTRVKEINSLSQKLDNGSTVRFLDFGAKFLEPDGSIAKDMMPDYVHPTSKGYVLYRDNLLPMIQKLLK